MDLAAFEDVMPDTDQAHHTRLYENQPHNNSNHNNSYNSTMCVFQKSRMTSVPGLDNTVIEDEDKDKKRTDNHDNDKDDDDDDDVRHQLNHHSVCRRQYQKPDQRHASVSMDRLRYGLPPEPKSVHAMYNLLCFVQEANSNHPSSSSSSTGGGVGSGQKTLQSLRVNVSVIEPEFMSKPEKITFGQVPVSQSKVRAIIWKYINISIYVGNDLDKRYRS